MLPDQLDSRYTVLFRCLAGIISGFTPSVLWYGRSPLEVRAVSAFFLPCRSPTKGSRSAVVVRPESSRGSRRIRFTFRLAGVPLEGSRLACVVRPESSQGSRRILLPSASPESHSWVRAWWCNGRPDFYLSSRRIVLLSPLLGSQLQIRTWPCGVRPESFQGSRRILRQAPPRATKPESHRVCACDCLA